MPNVSITLTDDEQFFYEQAGWSYTPGGETPEHGHMVTAVLLAHAEQLLQRDDMTLVVWEQDDMPCDAQEENGSPCDHSGHSEPWGATLQREATPPLPCGHGAKPAEVLGSLWGITFAPGEDPQSADYARVVAAELALEYL